MKLFAYSFLFATSAAFAGGSIGGSGMGKTQEELALSLFDSSNVGILDIPDLRLDKSEITKDDYRRAKARLSVDPTISTSVTSDGKEVQAKLLKGGLVNELENKQFVFKN